MKNDRQGYKKGGAAKEPKAVPTKTKKNADGSNSRYGRLKKVTK